MPYTYIVRCADDTLYTGCAVQLEKRVEAHNRGTGAKYTRGRGPVELVYWECYETLGEAQSREAAIKKLTRREKMKLLSKPQE